MQRYVHRVELKYIEMNIVYTHAMTNYEMIVGYLIGLITPPVSVACPLEWAIMHRGVFHTCGWLCHMRSLCKMLKIRISSGRPSTHGQSWKIWVVTLSTFASRKAGVTCLALICPSLYQPCSNDAQLSIAKVQYLRTAIETI